MEERTKTIGATRLLWSLILGLGLVLGLLWVMTPRAVVEAQAVNPSFTVGPVHDVAWDPGSLEDLATVARAGAAPASAPAPAPPHDDGEPPDFVPPHDRGGPPEDLWTARGAPLFASVGAPAGTVAGNRSLNAPLMTPPLPGSADLAICMTTDRVWGVVNAGETATVTVGSAQMGAALADGNGFFWTTLYDGNGDRPGLSGGETVAIYHDGTQEASISLRSITGQIDVVNDVVSGTIGGTTGFPMNVIIYAPEGEPSMTSYSQTVSTDGSGNFTADFTGVWDFIVWDEAMVAYMSRVVLRYTGTSTPAPASSCAPGPGAR